MTDIPDEAFRKLASARGFVRRTSPRRALAALGRSPDLLVDVGVCHGTKWFYDSFPGRPFLLVDPKRDCERQMTDRPANYRFVATGLSDRHGQLELADQGARSTLHTRTALTDWPTKARYAIELTTFDALIDRHGGDAARLGVKIDVEGHELAVIRGISAHARRIEFLVAELSVLNRFHDAPGFAEVVGALAERGLRFYNFLNPATPRPRRHVDCLFLQHDDPAFDEDGKE